MEADNGFSCDPTSHAEPPVAHLPMPPEPRRQQKQQQRRVRSSESAGRPPTSNSTEYLTTDNHGGGGSLDRRNLRKKDAQASVQVRVNPGGKSVTVYRVPPEENERDRRKRAWLNGGRNGRLALSRLWAAMPPGSAFSLPPLLAPAVTSSERKPPPQDTWAPPPELKPPAGRTRSRTEFP